MSYKKQNFVDGQVITAENLNYMEQGIEKATENAEKCLTWEYQNLTDVQKRQVRANLGLFSQEDINIIVNAVIRKLKSNNEV